MPWFNQKPVASDVPKDTVKVRSARIEMPRARASVTLELKDDEPFEAFVDRVFLQKYFLPWPGYAINTDDISEIREIWIERQERLFDQQTK